jgi:hypothetical protein
MAVHAREIERGYAGSLVETGKPNFLIYGAYFALCALAINTTFLVFADAWMKYLFLPMLIFGFLFSYFISRRWYVFVNQSLDVLSLAVSAYYVFRVMGAANNWGTLLAELLCLLLIMKSFKLFTVGDFYMPLMMSVTLMVFASLPSYSASYVISLFFYMILFGFALYTSQLREATRLERHEGRRLFQFTYRPTDYAGDSPLSRKSWREVWPYLSSGFKASLALALITFILCSFFFFQAERKIDEAKKSGLTRAFGGTRFAEQQNQKIDLSAAFDQQQNRPGGNIFYAGFTEDFNIAQGRLASINNPTPVMTVKTNVETYHRGRAFDIYTGLGWVQDKDYEKEDVILVQKDSPNLLEVDLNEKAGRSDVIMIDPLTADKTVVRQTYTIEEGMPRTGLLFTGYQANELALPRLKRIIIDDEFNIRLPDASDVLPRGSSYEVESYKLINPQKILSGQTYYQRGSSAG